MKILYSCLSRSWGGMEMFTVNSVRQLLNRGIETELLCYPESPIHKDALEKGILTHPIKAEGYFHPVQSFRVSQLIKKGKFDLVHTQASKDLWILSPALYLSNNQIPLIMTKQVGSFIIKKDVLHKLIYNRVTYALAISEVIAKNLIDTCPLTEDKIQLLHNSVDTKVFDPAITKRDERRKEFGISDNYLVIGMLGRFSPGKGHEEFLKAAKRLKSKYNNLKFMIVGEPSRGENNYGQTIIDMVSELELENDVIFTGFRKDTADVLSAMDVFIFPSHSEAFGIALIEAMAVGKPTVCSNSDGVLDIALDGITSFLFENQNSVELSEKIEKLISSPVLREQLGREGRKRAVTKFDVELLTNRVIEIYNQALSSNKKV